MKDIVERLRDRCDRKFINALCEDAAAEIERLTADLKAQRELYRHDLAKAADEIESLRGLNNELLADDARVEAEFERLKAMLRTNNHHLAKLVNGTDDDNPATWEDAKNQVLATRAALEPKP